MVVQTTPFVGRQADLQLLEDSLTRAVDGHGSLVLISGEAGIGKTRLCDELRRLPRDRPVQVLAGRAAQEEASIPFAALADTLRAARRSAPGAWEAAQRRVDVLWPIASELALGPNPPLRSADRPVLFEALLDAVDEAAGDKATLWILDDVHWADDSTWEFVRYASRRVGDLALVLAVTYREEEIGPAHPWWMNLVRLRRERNVITLRLQRLAAAEAGTLISALAPGTPTHMIARIIERSAGTPLLVEELASLASRSDQLPTVPDIVRATVRERAGRLRPRDLALLSVAAVAGTEMDAECLAPLRDDGRLDELVSVGLLERDERGYRFRHPLLHEAAYEDVPLERRRILHEQIAGALSKAGNHPSELVATHLERAGRPEAALSEVVTAAQDADRTGQVGQGATLYLGALQLALRNDSLADARAGLEQRAIRDLSAAGRWSELDPLVREAWVRRDRLTPAGRQRLAAVAGWNLFWNGAIHEASELVEKELAEIEQTGALDEGADLLTVAGTMAWWYRGDGGSARRLLARALEVADRIEDEDVAARARCTDAMVAYGLEGRRDVAVARLRDIAAFCRGHGLTVGEGLARLYLAFLTGTAEETQAAMLFWERTGAWYGSAAALNMAWLYVIEGRRRDAETIFGRIRAEMRLAVPTLAVVADSTEACLFLHRGDLDEARQLLYGPSAGREAALRGLFSAQWSAANGWLAWEDHRWEDATLQLARSAEQCAIGNNPTMGGRPIFLPLHVDAHLRLGQTIQAAAAVTSANSSSREHDRLFEAAIAAARFRLVPTDSAALEADGLAAAAPWPWLKAVVGCWRGEFLRDAEAAQRARHQFEEIGAHLGVQRAEGVLRRLGARQSRREDDWSSLSAREVEVAELVAQGLSNPAIARRLYLSRATIASHIARILTKLNFSSRAQIAAWVAERRTFAR